MFRSYSKGILIPIAVILMFVGIALADEPLANAISETATVETVSMP